MTQGTRSGRRPTRHPKAVGTAELRLPALEVRQGPNRTLYSFAVDGKLLSSFVTVSRVHRDEAAHIQGYQRPEVLAHISSIRKYVESEDPLIPNAVVVAFDKQVSFEPLDGAPATAYSRPGTLVIPLDPDCADEDKPGWVVDGQQRCAAIRDARVDSFPLAVSAFITESDADQRSQFILVNSTKPLPKGLIHELLPSTAGALPAALQVRRFPAYLLERLNYDQGSPFLQAIQTPTTPTGRIKDNSVLRMLENSLSDGVLYRFRNPATGEGDAKEMLKVLTDYWSAVQEVFPKEWELPPRKSRLVHGVGIISMGFVMDAIVDRIGPDRLPTHAEFFAEVSLLKDACAWTGGEWHFGRGHLPRRWNGLQNVPGDIRLLTNHLLKQYRERVR